MQTIMAFPSSHSTLCIQESLRISSAGTKQPAHNQFKRTHAYLRRAFPCSTVDSLSQHLRKFIKHASDFLMFVGDRSWKYEGHSWIWLDFNHQACATRAPVAHGDWRCRSEKEARWVNQTLTESQWGGASGRIERLVLIIHASWTFSIVFNISSSNPRFFENRSSGTKTIVS